MPKIYSEEKRQEIKENLKSVALDIIKQHGLKKMSVEEITKRVGIAQGTFYNFFKSKELLVFELANEYKEKSNKKVDEIIKNKGYLCKEDVRELYFNMILRDEDNVYRFLKRGDIQLLITRLPSECIEQISYVKNELKNNLNFVKGRKDNCDLDAIFNWIQIMNITIENKEILAQEGIEKIINKLIENMLDEIFKN